MRMLVLVIILSVGLSASARVLQVGPEAEYDTPSQAAASAQDGDTVEIQKPDLSGRRRRVAGE